MNQSDTNTVYPSLDNKEIHSFMEKDFFTLELNDTVDKAIAMLYKYNTTNLPVVDHNGRIRGSITYPIIVNVLLNGNHLSTKVHQVMQKDFVAYNGDDFVNQYQLNLNYPTPVINKNGQVIGTLHPEKVINKLFNLYKNWQSFEQVLESYEFCFDTAYEGITVVDANGYIKLFNDAYSRFVGVSKKEAIGKHCSEVIENTRLPVVLETGIPERNQPHILQGQSMIVNRLPIWKGATIIGAVGMLIFEGVSELYDTFNRVQQFNNIENGERILLHYPKPSEKTITFEQIIGESISLGIAKKIARKAAKTTSTILLTGESGVGKELFAKSIHHASPVSNGPLVSINCAAIPDDLLESELFGYDHGAFTGAKKGGKPGKFELAHKGTLFLDEIGEMSMHLQAKLLRVLQDQRFERVGGNGEIQVNVRIIAATNQSLEDQLKEGKFREDLFYRLNIIPIEIPPLRERKSDIPLLVSVLLKEICNKYNLSPVELSKEAMKAFLKYDWPGNIRELANVIERVVVLTESRRVELKDLPTHIGENEHHQVTYALDKSHLLSEEQEYESTKPSLPNDLKKIKKQTSEDQERELLLKIMREVGGNKSKAAKVLGIHRSTLYKKLNQYGIDDFDEI